MENKNNIDWNVNLNYITKDDLKTIYGFIPDADQTTIDKTKTDFTIMAIAISSERINTITGNQIEIIEFKNLNETQQQLVKRATARMTIYYLTDGMAFIRSSVSISGNGLSSSISPPSEPDYILMEVYNLLQQANLHTPRKALNSYISCNNNDFNTPSIWDEGDIKTVTWNNANKTFLQKIGIIEGTGVKIDDVSDTIPKLKINTTSKALLPNYDSPKETIYINYDKEKDIVNVDISNKIEDRLFTDKFNKDITEKITDILNPNTAYMHVDYKYDLQFDKYTPNTLIPKKYVDDTVNQSNLWNQTSSDVNLKFARDINLQGYNLTRVGDPTKEDDGVNKRYVDNFKEQWKNVGNKISDTQINYNFINGKKYKITYTTGTIDNAKMYKKIIYTGKSTILETIYTDSNTWTRLHISSDNKVYTESKTLLGYILLLEELKEENIYKINSKTLNIIQPTLINMQKPIYLNSNTLLTNELEENNWEIEQKENPTSSPCPCPKWKEVGILEKNEWGNWQITYKFKDDKQYRVFYNWGEHDYIKIIKEFIFNLPITTNEITSFQDEYTHQLLTLRNGSNITIYTIKGELKGKLWKLQELQE